MEFNATFLVTIISFVLFVHIMNRILYVPICNMIERRRSFIDENLQSADKNHNKAAQIAEEKEDKLRGARADAKNNYTNSVNDYKDKRTEILDNARKLANEDTISAFNDLEVVSNETKEGLKSRMTELANDIVEKVLGYRSEVREFDNDAVNRILYQ